ncbi:MAG: glycoside hydrolase, partial [Bacteroidaceae bacterium]|nr:glycoside hydrolase [Bacteroidaceae bacterium]
NYTGRVMTVDLTKIDGKKKKAWWYNPTNAEYSYIGEYKNRVVEFVPVECGIGKDIVLVVTDSDAGYIRNTVDETTIEQKNYEE